MLECGEVKKTILMKGRKHDRHLIHLDTFDFLAKEFYHKNGHVVFGELRDCPKIMCVII